MPKRKIPAWNEASSLGQLAMACLMASVLALNLLDLAPT